MLTVRFNLERGNDFMKWKITDSSTGRALYFPYDEVTLIMHECILKNRKRSAKKIFDGHSKFVCAWIQCKYVEVVPSVELDGLRVMYNPRVNPYWTDELTGKDIDGKKFSMLTTCKNNVFISDPTRYQSDKIEPLTVNI